MPRRVAQTASLTAEFVTQVASGRRAGGSDVVRAALDGLVRREARHATGRPAETNADRH